VPRPDATEAALSQALYHKPFPKPALYGAAALVALTIVGAFAARTFGPFSNIPHVPAVASCDLSFRDLPNGGVSVLREPGGRQIAVIAPGTGGFVRSTLRSLAFARGREQIGPAAPFRLTAWSDRRLTLDDPATGRHIELAAFGATNEGAFANLLRAGLGAP
jgi:putative photosynthetic complex assembly protein